MVRNQQLIYNKVPVGVPIPGETLVLKTSEFDVPEAKIDGGVVLKNLALSLDPYMRGRMRDPKIQSYAAAYDLGKPIHGFAIGEVIRTEAATHPLGSLLYGFGTFEEYSIITKDQLKNWRIVDNSVGLPYTTLVGGAGMSGQTAFWGYHEIGKPQKGETIFVSAGAGAVGQVAIQLAKKDGLKVVASAGDAQKVEFLKSLGVDVAFNYKTESTFEILQANPPDIYFDNVGGETLDAVLATMNTFGRIIACGSVSQYNLKPEEKYRLANWGNVVAKQITFQGFIVSGKNLDKFFETVPKLIKSGDLKIREYVTHGLDNGQAFVDMLSGKAQGKAVISLV